jgi:hypothetical protein
LVPFSFAMMRGASHLNEEATTMDGLSMYTLGRILYEERLRDAERRGRLWRSNQFHRLPKLVQFLLAALS